MEDGKLSRAEAIAASAEFEIECPSGNKYLVRKGSPREVMMLTGEIPVDRELLPEGTTEPDALEAPKPVVDEKLVEALEVGQRFLDGYCLDPKVVPLDYPAKGDPAKREAAYWQVSGDVTHLVEIWIKVCMGQLKPEGGTVPFRDGECSGDPGPAGGEVRSTPASGSKS